jgi:23S rRNA (uridine2552-2'-O)-methyltransferase
VLDRGAAQILAELEVERFTCGAIITSDAHFDQAMRVQPRIDLFLHAGGEPIVADDDDRIEVVRVGAMRFALLDAEFYFWHVGVFLGGVGQLSPAQHNKPMKIKSKKVNKAWFNDHINDPYVKMAKKDGYRARAAYKLKEIDETLKLLKPGQVIVDLGSAPGAWSQYARRKLAPKDEAAGKGGGAAVGELNGVIIALDILPMEVIEGVQFIQGDFSTDEVLQELLSKVERSAQIPSRPDAENALKTTNEVRDIRVVDVVISDMAPNLSGVASSDSARIAELIELAVNFSQLTLKPEGALVVKLFHGSGYSQLVELFKKTFKVVKPIKPKASRDKSAETFLVGMGLKPASLKSPENLA